MKLTQKAIDAIKNNKRVRARLQLDLDKSEFTINRYIADNDTNGMLTTAAALRVIREELEIGDSEILEENNEKSVA